MKKFYRLFGLFLIFSACALQEKKSAAPPAESFSLADFQKSFSLTDAVLSPDGQTVFYLTNKSQYPKVWKIDLKTKSDELFFDLGRPVHTLAMAPSGQYLILQADQGGDENDEIFSLNIRSKNIYKVSGKSGSRNAMCAWSPNGKKIAFSSSERTPAAFDIYLSTLAEDGTVLRAPEILLKSDDINDCGKFSPDGRKYAFLRFLSNSVQQIHVIDLPLKKSRLVTGKGEAAHSGIAWLGNSKEIISASNVKTDFKNLVSLNPGSGEIRLISNNSWNAVEFFNDPKANLSSMTLNEDGYVSPKFYGKDFRTELRLEALPKGIVTTKGWSRDGSRILVSVETSAQPAELFLIDRSRHEVRKLTELNQSPVPKKDLVEANLIRLRSEDGVGFSSWLMRPRSEKKNGVAVIFVHGGPEDQVQANYSFYRQYFLNLGFTLIIPNFRGSTGYGTQFQKMVYRDWGGGHIKDLMASRKYLIENEGIAADKVAILGGSFGGFSVLSAITQHPTAFCSAVDIFGPANLFSFIAAAPPHWKKSLAELLGDPEKDKDRLRTVSPFFSVDKITTPLLVVQGANDPRVKKEESEQVVASLKRLGKPVEYILFPDEGHGFSKNENQIRAFESAGGHIRNYCK